VAGKKVKSPDGDEWMVRRRLDGGRKRKRRRLGLSDGTDAGLESLFDWAPDVELDESILFSLALIALYAILVVLAVVVLGLLLEIVVPVLLAIYGLLTALALLRPWTVEAVDLVEPERKVALSVKGWRRSAAAVKALTREIETSGEPGRVQPNPPSSEMHSD
jgi:hypothetical protein